MPNATILLRKLLLTDAATCFAMGVLLSAGATSVAAYTAIPTALLMYAGIALFAIAAAIAVIATQAATSVPYVALVVIGNVLWVAGSLALSVLEQHALRRVTGGSLVRSRGVTG